VEELDAGMVDHASLTAARCSALVIAVVVILQLQSLHLSTDSDGLTVPLPWDLAQAMLPLLADSTPVLADMTSLLFTALNFASEHVASAHRIASVEQQGSEETVSRWRALEEEASRLGLKVAAKEGEAATLRHRRQVADARVAAWRLLEEKDEANALRCAVESNGRRAAATRMRLEGAKTEARAKREEARAYRAVQRQASLRSKPKA